MTTRNIPTTTTIEDKRWLSVREAAVLLGVTTPTLREWVRERGLPAVQVAKVIRIDAAALDRWLAAHAVGGRSPCGPPTNRPPTNAGEK